MITVPVLIVGSLIVGLGLLWAVLEVVHKVKNNNTQDALQERSVADKAHKLEL